MTTETLYGAKCHICTHLLGLHKRDVIVPSSPCDDCLDCQYDPFVALLQQAGRSEEGLVTDPEVRAAAKAIRNGQPHPLVDQLRAEITDHIGSSSGGSDSNPQGQ